MAASESDQILDIFLTQVQQVHDPAYGRDFLFLALEPALEFEASIRAAFAADEPRDHRLMDPYCGIFDVFSIPANARCIQSRKSLPMGPGTFPNNSRQIGSQGENMPDNYHTYYLPDLGPICSFSRDYMFPLGRNFTRATGDPCMVETMDSFRENFRIFSHGALASITNDHWSNMIVTGGSVVASLLGLGPARGFQWSGWDFNERYQSELYRSSDIDIFFYGLTPEEAIDKAEEIYGAIKRSDLWTTAVVRKADKISIHSLYPCRPIQISLNLYASPAEILANCDIDCASCAYDGTTVYMNPRALISFICQTNKIDLKRWSPSYEIRLANYAKRGFEIHVPFLERERINYEHLYDRHLQDLPTRLGRLITLELHSYLPNHFDRLSNYTLRRVGPNSYPTSAEFAPIDMRMINSEESLWAHVPYGPSWDFCGLSMLTVEIDRELNPGPTTHSMPRRRLHRHPIYSSDLLFDCLQDICPGCPVPQSPAEEEIYRSEEGLYCRGPLKFYVRDERLPKNSELVGANDNERISEWTKWAYLSEDSLDRGITTLCIPREMWLSTMMSSNWDLYSGGANYYEVEGAGLSSRSREQISLDIRRFWETYNVIHGQM